MDSIKHTLEECDLIKCYFKGDYKATSMGAPSGSAGGEGNRDVYLDPKGCLMIISGPATHESKCRQKAYGQGGQCGHPGRRHPSFPKMVGDCDHF
jgi:hypothetical protein